MYNILTYGGISCQIYVLGKELENYEKYRIIQEKRLQRKLIFLQSFFMRHHFTTFKNSTLVAESAVSRH